MLGRRAAPGAGRARDRNPLEYLRETVLGAYLQDTDRARAQGFLLARHTTDYA